MKKLELMKGPFSPKEKIEYAEGSIVSQEFIHNRAGNLTLFSFDEGQQLSEHTAPFDAVPAQETATLKKSGYWHIAAVLINPPPECP